MIVAVAHQTFEYIWWILWLTKNCCNPLIAKKLLPFRVENELSTTVADWGSMDRFYNTTSWPIF